MNKYDAINTYAVQLILWNNDKHGDLCFKNISGKDEDLWLMSVVENACFFRKMKIYYCGNFLNYLWLKYIKKFQFLKFYIGQKGLFMIDGTDFKDEIVIAFNENSSYLQDIYNEYYRR